MPASSHLFSMLLWHAWQALSVSGACRHLQQRWRHVLSITQAMSGLRGLQSDSCRPSWSCTTETETAADSLLTVDSVASHAKVEKRQQIALLVACKKTMIISSSRPVFSYRRRHRCRLCLWVMCRTRCATLAANTTITQATRASGMIPFHLYIQAQHSTHMLCNI